MKKIFFLFLGLTYTNTALCMQAPAGGDRKRTREIVDVDTPLITPNVGFTNDGSNCFMNASIQALYHLQPFRNYLETYVHTSAITNLLSTHLNAVTNAPRALSSHVFRHAVCPVLGLPEEFLVDQQDPTEFLVPLLNGIQEGLSMAARRHTQNVSSISYDLVTSITHPCGRTHEKRIPINEFIFTVPLDKDSLAENLSDLLTPHRTDEAGHFRCESTFCKNRELPHQLTEHYQFTKTPDIFICRLAIFGFDRVKNRSIKRDKVIKIPFGLQLSEDSMYRLTSFIVHNGNSPYSGHYWSYARIGDTWYRYNCTGPYAERVSTHHVRTLLNHTNTSGFLDTLFKPAGTPYVLFFEKIQ